MTPKVFHKRARECLRTARECPDLVTREDLLERAAGFARSAFDLERIRAARDRARSTPPPMPTGSSTGLFVSA
jgi:hypothetical protein